MPVPLAILALGCVASAPALSVTPTRLDFGEVPVGESASDAATVENTGDATAEIDSISLLGTSADAWTLTDPEPADLFPGASARIGLAFSPLAVGDALGRLEVRSNDPERPTITVELRGHGSDAGNGADTDGVDTGDTGVADGDTDADGDGWSTLDGDCDDADPGAWPVLVDASGTSTGDGTPAAPFSTLDAGLAALDPICRTVLLGAGTWLAQVVVEDGQVTIRGASKSAADVILTPPAGSRAFEVRASGRLVLADLTLQGARGTDGDGGALLVDGGSARLVGVRVIDNQAAEDGGAIALSGGEVTLDGCTLAGNVATQDGGALHAWASTVTDTGSTWTGNTAESGGALAIQESGLTTDGAAFDANTASDAGGGLFVREATDLRVERSAFHDNDAGWRGGGIAIEDTELEDGWLRNLVLTDNRATGDGGGVSIRDSRILVANNTLLWNTAGDEGGGLYVGDRWEWDEGGPWLWSNIVAWSDGTSGVSAGTGASVAYTLAWSNAGDDLALTHGADDGENTVADPLFVAVSDDGDPGNDDLTPGAGSPAIDAGPETGGPSGYDWADADGSRNDRGVTGGAGAE